MNTILLPLNPLTTTQRCQDLDTLSVSSVSKNQDSLETQLPAQTNCLKDLVDEELRQLKVHRMKRIAKTAKKTVTSSKWTTNEISKMLELMRIFGTDFSMMETRLTTKSRDQIKRKFTQLQRTCADKVQAALSGEHNAEMWIELLPN